MVGYVVQVNGPLVDVRFDGSLPCVTSALEVQGSRPRLVLEVLQHLPGGLVRSVAMGATDGIASGQEVLDTCSPIKVPVGRGTIGHMFDVIGESVDGEGADMEATDVWPIYRQVPLVDDDSATESPQILVTGIKVLDLLVPLKRGGRVCIIAQPDIGATSLLMELMHNVAKAHGGSSVFAATRQSNMEDSRTMYREMVDSGIIKLGAQRGESMCTMVHVQEDAPLGPRARVGLTGLTMAEYLRDVEGQDVLLVIDGGFEQANVELSHLLTGDSSAEGYVAPVDHGGFRNRIAASAAKGSITRVQDIFIPGDLTLSMADFALETLDTAIVLCRETAIPGVCPAVDVMQSRSQALEPWIIGAEHYAAARGVLNVLQRYKEVQGIMAMLGEDELSAEDKLYVARARRIQQFLGQPLHVAEASTGVPGVYVPLDETIQAFQGLVNGEYDDMPVEAFSMVGGIAEAKEKAAAIAAR